ncbi:transcriptional regulator [Endozoicomonas montiporae]|uniref:Transcriptional regulator n=2 Tax=Endozoicomonas montiporae TaxID=1027273 RepID=A0A081N2N6_9GAMM|nr:helix-turn-helix domain-containing protein [Endozoicomonas montiporae]AMO57967.1 TetR family transcriptional regulator [Endozoicomonas montiporae CL-33]KEQ12709.1 transcriptional regulator [Endozoicomonas montiporae]
MKKRGRPSGAGSSLSADKIILAARELLTAEGKVPSIRRLSAELGVDAMAIYHYFSSKAVLLEAVTVALVSDIYKPEGRGDWQGDVLRLCISYVSLLNRHPGLLETMLSMKKFGPADVFRERFELALAPLSLPKVLIDDALNLIADYLHGFVLAMECQNMECQKKSGAILATDIERPVRMVMFALEQNID